MAINTYRSDLSLNEKVIMAVVRASELFKKDTAAIFKNWGLTFSQYNVLRVLEASEEGRNIMSNISKIMLVSGANMTGLAKRLDKNGFLVRKNDPNDDRITWLEITPKGRKALKDIAVHKDNNLSRYMEGFTDKEKHEILEKLRILNRMIMKTSRSGPDLL